MVPNVVMAVVFVLAASTVQAGDEPVMSWGGELPAGKDEYLTEPDCRDWNITRTRRDVNPLRHKMWGRLC